MGVQIFKLQEKGEEFARRLLDHKLVRSKEFEAGKDASAPAVVDMAIYHVPKGVADIKIGSTISGSFGEGQEFDTIFAGPRIPVRWCGKTDATIYVLTGTKVVMEVFSPV